MDERRKAPRHKTLLQGRAYYNNRNSSAECVVRDISTHGARVMFTDSITVPDIVDLHIPVKDKTYRAQIVWRHGSEAGIAFDVPDQAANTADGGGLAARVAKLEQDIEALKRTVKRLKAETAGSDTEAA